MPTVATECLDARLKALCYIPTSKICRPSNSFETGQWLNSRHSGPAARPTVLDKMTCHGFQPLHALICLLRMTETRGISRCSPCELFQQLRMGGLMWVARHGVPGAV